MPKIQLVQIVLHPILYSMGLQIEFTYMKALLTKGWYVLTADYEGSTATFCAGRLAGVSNLNSIRGTLSSTEMSGLESSAEVVLWGYSGGTIPSSWAAALQPSYAPELSENLIGIAIGGWVAFQGPWIILMEHIFAGLVASGSWASSSKDKRLSL